MAKQVQLRRGTRAANAVFVGATGEVSMDTESKDLRLHDGSTVGGFRIPSLVAVQYPTEDNNYTWYRKWSDGWVEQGILNILDGAKFTFPVVMADTNYSVVGISKVTAGELKTSCVREDRKTTTDCVLYFTSGYYGYIEVKGMAA